MGEYAGGEANRTGGPLPNLSGRLTPGNAVGAPAADAGKPEFTAAGLSHIDSSAADIDADLDAEQATREKQMRRLGFSDEEITRLRGEAGEPAAPAPSRASIEQKLAELKALKASNPKAYWSDETQAKELAIIEQREKLKAGPAKAAAEKAEGEEQQAEPQDSAAAEGAAELAKVEEELADIKKARRENPRSLTKEMESRELELIDRREILQANAQHLPGELVEAWRKEGGLKHNLDQARGTARAALDNLEAGDAEALQASFDALPETIRTEAFRYMALDGGGHTRSASDASVEAFAGIGEEAAALVRSWGGKASQKLGAAYGKLDMAVASLSEEDAARAEAWLGGLSVKQKAAVIRAMAG
jgi:hypothetical protein